MSNWKVEFTFGDYYCKTVGFLAVSLIVEAAGPVGAQSKALDKVSPLVGADIEAKTVTVTKI